jgi:hypothetical protein
MQSSYNQHSYALDYVWNLDETRIQANKQIRPKVYG